MIKSVFIFFIVLLFTSCSMLDLNSDLKNLDKLSTINVKVDSNNKTNQSIIVVLVNLDKSSIVDYRVVQNDNELITFFVMSSTYKIFAYEDSNRDFKYSIHERNSKSEAIHIDHSNSIQNIQLVIHSPVEASEIPYMTNLVKRLRIDIHRTTTHNGSVISLSSNMFSDTNRTKGLWEPYRFMFEVPFGIFLEKEYDPNKKVVLFIHGISGSPKNFTYLINDLDKSKYQVFYAYYPTGVSISEAAAYLSRVLSELEIRLEFQDIAIVAHSMGGLVSRDMITILAEHHNYIDTFISISSPFNGDTRAELGVQHSPVIIPVWKDMSNESLFIKTLYRQHLNKKINYYLVFSVKSSNNDDGVVSIPSQLRLEAQKEAKVVRGYNEDHMSILNSKETAQFIYNRLDENY